MTDRSAAAWPENRLLTTEVFVDATRLVRSIGDRIATAGCLTAIDAAHLCTVVQDAAVDEGVWAAGSGHDRCVLQVLSER